MIGLMTVFSLMAASVAPVAAAGPAADDDTKEIRNELRGQGVTIDWKRPPPDQARGDDTRPPKVGDTRVWLSLNDITGSYVPTFFTFRGASKGAEVWVRSSGLSFPAGDCRNDGVRNVVTDQQIAYLLNQFDSNIRPIDTAWFGEPVRRDGRNAIFDEILTGQFGIPTSSIAYRNNQARDVILIDNVRDDNYFDTNNANSLPYIAGFFTSAMSYYFDRNVITIDSWDWVHRTGANPAHNPSTDPCTNSPARPFRYEGIFAHEYQHLIHEDYDGGELNWVNEGMSDLAAELTGYSNPAAHIDEKAQDGHMMAILGWLNVFHPDWNPIPSEDGPENSLTTWGDQGAVEILEDYGIAYYFMTYLMSHGYGQDFFTAWHHNPLHGIEGLNDTLAAFGSSDTFDSLLQDVVVSMLTDAYVDAGATVSGDTDAAAVSASSTNSTLFINEQAYGTPGAPTFGSDYLPLGSGSALTSVAFDGDEALEFGGGTDWTFADGYWNSPDEAGKTTYAAFTDASIAGPVAGGTTLTFEHYYAMETGWDYGFVRASTDGGTTFTSLACTGTTSEHDPGAEARMTANLPGFTGPSLDPADTSSIGTAAAPVAVSCTLPAGTTHISFLLQTDELAHFDGWHVRNVAIDGGAVDMSGFDNEQFLNPLDYTFGVQLVGITGTADEFGHVTAATSVVVVRASIGAGNTWTATAADLAELAGSDAVYAIVTGGTPENEQSGEYAPYSLLVNGTERADGAGL
jgi:hypothetical protein